MTVGAGRYHVKYIESWPHVTAGHGTCRPGFDLAEVDGNRTRRKGFALPNRFEGGGAHQVPGHLRWRA
jgi:hypothetical protein